MLRDRFPPRSPVRYCFGDSGPGAGDAGTGPAGGAGAAGTVGPTPLSAGRMGEGGGVARSNPPLALAGRAPGCGGTGLVVGIAVPEPFVAGPTLLSAGGMGAGGGVVRLPLKGPVPGGMGTLTVVLGSFGGGVEPGPDAPVTPDGKLPGCPGVTGLNVVPLVPGCLPGMPGCEAFAGVKVRVVVIVWFGKVAGAPPGRAASCAPVGTCGGCR